jgi:hypothetical protein
MLVLSYVIYPRANGVIDAPKQVIERQHGGAATRLGAHVCVLDAPMKVFHLRIRDEISLHQKLLRVIPGNSQLSRYRVMSAMWSS